MILINFLLFFIACIFSFYIPGLVLVDILKLKLSKVDGFIVSWILGVCLFILLTYIFAWINISFVIFIILFFCLAYAIRKKILLPSISLGNTDLISVFIIILGSISFLSITFFSGLNTASGLQFISVNGIDGIVHISRILNQTIFFPPQHPGLSGIEFRGYHYFYDFLLSRFVLNYHFSSMDLYFRFFPAFISLLYGGGFYLIGTLVTNDLIRRRLILFLAFFAQSFAFLLLPINKNYEFVQGAQLVQSIGLILDPSVVLSIAILLTGLFFLQKVKESWKYGVLVGLMFGILTQIKVYAGITGIACLIIYSCFIFLIYKRKFIFNYLFTVFITGFLTAITYFPNNLGVGSLIFAPLLIYKHYMEQALFAEYNWELKRIIFAEHQNTIRVLLLYLEAIIIFWVVNLGIRIVPLFFIKKMFSKIFWTKDINIILLTMVATPIIISSFFIQSISVFDILQFNWMVLAILSIPAGLALGEVIQKKNFFLTGALFIFFVIIIMQNANFVSSYLFPLNKYVISKDETLFYGKVSSTVPQGSFIATLAENEGPLVSAITGRSTYYEREIISYPLDSIYNERKNNLSKLKEAIEACNYLDISNQMSKINTKYLTTPFISPCLTKSPNLKTYFNTSSLAFYEFK